MNVSVSHAQSIRPLSIVLIGNPNTGKTTLFNALTGLRHRVGNYPGVTVETKTARARFGSRPIDVTDVPGTYSLSPRSPDEMLAVDLLLGNRPEIPKPDAVVCIVDASNIERNLYLTTQILELGIPVVLALNMTDVADSQDIQVDARLLSQSLGIPVIRVQANAKKGVSELITAVEQAANSRSSARSPEFPAPFRDAVEQLSQSLGHSHDTAFPRYLIVRALLDVGGASEWRLADRFGSKISTQLQEFRDRLANEGCPIPAVEPRIRYRWIAEHVRPAVRRPSQRKQTSTDRIDRILLHRVWGIVVFLVLMTIIFQSIYTLADYVMSPIDAGFGALGEWVEHQMPEGPVRSLLVNGIIAGVGNVLIFLPQILILFGFLAVLEDCGYMARAAFLMDKVMAGCGLSGKSFVPLLSSFACAVPGIMSARTIENRRDRIATVLIAPLMSCSARLPVYVLLIGAFVSATPIFGPFTYQGLVLVALYCLGLLIAPLVAWTLKKTLLRGEKPVFIMELPGYKWPSIETVIWRMLERGWSFIRRAGTLILATTIVIWALQYYPRPPEIEAKFGKEIAELEEKGKLNGASTEELEAQRIEIEHRMEAAYQEQSFLGRLGKFVEPAVKPLGWDWRIGMAAIASFPAREVVVSALGTIYSVGHDVDDSDEDGSFTRLQNALRNARWPNGQIVFTLPVALSILVFFALCSQCAATLVVIRKELNSSKWAAFTFVYMTTLAYLGALVTYQVGTWLTGGGV